MQTTDFQGIVRRFALAGILAPLIISGTVAIAGFLEPDYNPFTQLVSELADGNARFGWITNLLVFILSGSLMVIFAVEVYCYFGKSMQVGAGLLAVVGLTLVGLGIFPCDPGCPPTPETVSGWLHFPVLNSIITITFMATLGVFWYKLRLQPEWKGLAVYSLITGMIALTLILGPIFQSWGKGFWQRLIFGTLFLWVTVLALKLYLTDLQKQI